MEASELEGGHALTSEALMALARRRLADELAALPPADSAAGRAALLATSPPGASLGALAHAIRRAMRVGRGADAHALFAVLLQRIDGLNRKWLAHTLRSASPYASGAMYASDLAQDLAQELTLLLWEQIGLRDNEAWELFFQRALAYAQGHVAASFLRRQGLRADPRVAQPHRGLALVFSRLADGDDETVASAPVTELAVFDRADLADLRALVLRLPPRERLAVVLRFWQQASESEIAEALGGVTTRAVRYMLRRAYGRLRAWYIGERDDAPAALEAQEVDHGDQR